MNKLSVFLITLPLMFSFIENDWKKVNSEDNITVYNTVVEGIKFKKSKVETTIEYGSIEKAEAILKDIENYKDWQPRCEASKSLKVEGNKIIMHLTFGAPWPISDRDLIMESTFKKEKNKLIITSQCLPKHIPEDEDIVRIAYCKSKWEIEMKADEKLFIRHTNHADPGGNLPAWLTSSATVDIPLELMQGFIDKLD